MKTKSILIIAFILLISKPVFSQTAFKVEVKGKGTPILLFPGFGCTGEVWNETKANFEKKYTCYILYSIWTAGRYRKKYCPAV